jgi:dTDP-4-dehydrorhamnose reductase
VGGVTVKILVTGAKGQLGFDVVNEAEKRGYEVVGVDIDELDITVESHVNAVLTRVNPDVVIHCAAWTAVDAAEDNVEKVRAVNAHGTENIAKICGQFDCKLIYISTDYVFDGQGKAPWKPDDKCKPLGVYGQTKYEGELVAEKYCEKLFIIRTSWVFGINGNNFVKTILNLAKTRDNLSIVNDQIGTPTYTYDLARLLVDMAESDKYGKYHATNEGNYISRFDFASEIFKQANVTIELKPVTSAEFPTKAKRPLNSRLDKSKLVNNGFKPLSDWKDALRIYLNELEF